MAETPDNAGFADDFLDDFFAESEEHLAAVRRSLLALEAALPRGAAAPDILEEMFRRFHSLKGISGMVRLEDAEALAHDMEGYLRALRDGEVRLNAGGVEALIDGTRALDEVIGARRRNQAEPDVRAVRARLAALVPPGSPRAGRQSGARSDAAAAPSPEAPLQSSGADTWRVVFVPSNDLLARGVNVNVVREHLRSVGEIVEARPKITEAGGIAFEFIVSTASPAAFGQWRDEGISYEPVTAGLEDASARVEVVAGPTVPPPVSSSPGVSPVGSRMVRVDLSRLDDVMERVADIVVTRTRLDEALERVEDRVPQGEWRALQEADQTIERQLRRLREAVMRLRLVPVGEIFGKMPFVVRDLARDNGKQVTLDVHGQRTEIDKFLVERMMDPILHLVRNAISHGIERPDERLARGKPAVGTIGLRATTVGEWVVIEVEDDGRGIDRDAVTARARQAGLEVPATVDVAVLLDLLCAPGLSTRDNADRASGRGVGMAVVREAVDALSGSLELQTEPGRGTRFVMTVPVTLAIIDALICRIAGQRFAVPQATVREVLELAVEDVRSLEGNEIFRYRQATLPLVRLADVLDLDRGVTDRRLHVIVVGSGGQAVGLGVDRIAGQREIVVRAIADPLMRVDGVSGATELGDGQPVLILDPPALVRMARTRARTGIRSPAPGAGGPEPGIRDPRTR